MPETYNNSLADRLTRAEDAIRELQSQVYALKQDNEEQFGSCTCSHDYDDHALDLERGDRLYCQRCECRRYLSAATFTTPGGRVHPVNPVAGGTRPAEWPR